MCVVTCLWVRVPAGPAGVISRRSSEVKELSRPRRGTV